MQKTRTCNSCNDDKPIGKFSRNIKNGKKFGWRKVCMSCKSKKHYKVKPLFSTKYDPRFKWDAASFEDKIKQVKLSFNSHVIRKDVGCWGWDGSNAKGYGNLTFEKRPMRAHRVSWVIHNGLIPKGKWVLHTCDNSICTNPKHLFLGSPKDNVRDMFNKGRENRRYGSNHSFAKLNEEKVVEIRKLLISKNTQSSIAEKYKVSRGVISDIKRNRTWKHVTI